MQNHILIKAKKQVFSEHLGTNLSPIKGEGYDFIELREYEYGEDIKKIDWTTSAKLQKPYVKVYHDTKELNIVISCMLGGSVLFGTSNTKQETIAQISALLGFSSIKQNDPFSYHFYTSKNIQYTKPNKQIFSVNKMVENIISFNPKNHISDYKYMAHDLFYKIKNKSLIFIIGDFLNEFDLKLLSTKHEVIAIVVRDKFEENPLSIDEINMIDPSTNKNYNTSLNTNTIKKYKTKIIENDNKMTEHFRQNNIKWCKVYTNQDPIISLRKLFI